VHPIMAVPAILLLCCMQLPLWIGVAGLIAGCAATFGLAVISATVPAVSDYLQVMDPAWLEIVQERSQFLFLNFWRAQDWELAARPVVSLALAALVTKNGAIRKMCLSAILIGLSGLLLTSITSSANPLAVLVQGQAWRWSWVTDFVAVLMLAPTALVLWNRDRCGPLCATLLVAAWIWNSSITGSLLLVACALLLWLLKNYLPETIVRHLSGDAVRSFVVGCASRIFLWRPSLPLRAGGLLIASAAALYLVPASLRQPEKLARQFQEQAEFEDWRRQIPPASNVLIIPVPTNATFLWATLDRPSYLSLDQSSGVVFSRATALEIRRRSEVLLPIAEPDWKLMSQIRVKKSYPHVELPALYNKLTAALLVEICNDSQLGFVVAKEAVGFAPMRHATGSWKDWNLYDCGKVRSSLPRT
jgi:hypothetical protein